MWFCVIILHFTLGNWGQLICGFLVLLIWTGSFKEYGRLLPVNMYFGSLPWPGLFLYSLLRVESRMLAGFTIGLFVQVLQHFELLIRNNHRDLREALAWPSPQYC